MLQDFSGFLQRWWDINANESRKRHPSTDNIARAKKKYPRCQPPDPRCQPPDFCYQLCTPKGVHNNGSLHRVSRCMCLVGWISLRWRRNGCDGVSNHQPHHCLLNRLFRSRSKKTSKLRVTGLCTGNSLGTGEFPTQMASNAENVSIWWRHHVLILLESTGWYLWYLISCSFLTLVCVKTIPYHIVIPSDWIARHVVAFISAVTLNKVVKI